MEGAGADRDPRGVRRPGALQPQGVRGGAGLGDRRRDHQRDGRLDRHRSPVRGDGRTARHDAGERDAAPRRPVRPDLRVRAGRDGVRRRPGAPLMAGPALTWDVHDGIAVVTLDSKDQPVNVISRAVKDEFIATFELLGNDSAVKAVAFFSGKRDNFIAGADIEEFVRLSSAAAAERLSAGGQEMPERTAQAPQPLAAARKLAGGWKPKRRRPGGFVGWLLDGTPLGRALVFRMARQQVQKQTRGNYPAPLAALEVVAYGLRHGIAEGLKREAQLFGQLAVTDVSRKLVQIFFATTQLKKDFGVPNPPPPAPVRRLGVVGAGFMGAGIAGTAVAQAAVDVRLKDADLPRVAKGLASARDI